MWKKYKIAIIILALVVVVTASYFIYKKLKVTENPIRKTFDDTITQERTNPKFVGDKIFSTLVGMGLVTQDQGTEANEAANSTPNDNDSEKFIAISMDYAHAIIDGIPHSQAILLIK